MGICTYCARSISVVSLFLDSPAFILKWYRLSRTSLLSSIDHFQTRLHGPEQSLILDDHDFQNSEWKRRSSIADRTHENAGGTVLPLSSTLTLTSRTPQYGTEAFAFIFLPKLGHSASLLIHVYKAAKRATKQKALRSVGKPSPSPEQSRWSHEV